MRIHGAAGDQATFDQVMRIVAQDFAILAGAGLGFVGVDQQVVGAAIVDLGHERPFEAGRETRAATATQAGGLDLVGDPVPTLVEKFLGAIPTAALARAFEAPVALAVKVGEDAILVSEQFSHS
jgi:hypothetical protein